MTQTGPDFEPSGFFVVRSPLLPLRAFTDLSAGAGWWKGESTLAEARSLVRSRLRAWMELPEVVEAIFVATPSVHDRLAAWLSSPESAAGAKVEPVLVRYFARMCGRATPFGLFAGCSVGAIGERTEMVFGPRVAYQRHSRLDNEHLFALCEELNRDSNLRGCLTFFPNSSLYRAPDRWRYAEAKLKGRVRRYELVAVDPSPHLDAAITRAARGATLAELSEAVAGVVSERAFARDEVEAFVAGLIDGQLLVSSLWPLVTGPEPLVDLLAQLQALAPARAVFHGLEHAAGRLAEIDRVGIGAPVDAYRELTGGLEALPAKPEIAHLVQVDLVKPALKATLGPDVVAELTRAAHLFAKLGGAVESRAMRAFRDAFVARWDAQEIPLVEALDPDSGIGFGDVGASDGDADVVLRGRRPERAAPSAPALRPRDAALVRLAGEALAREAIEIELGDEDIAALAADVSQPLPAAFSILATLCARSEEAAARGDFRLFVESLSGPSGARQLGRFCHADAELHQRVRAHVRAEEALHPDAILAEIAHVAQGRTGNILVRPVLREHEITYLGRSGVPAEGQIGIDDLLVRVEGGRVRLRSRRLRREIVARLTTAHNYSLGLPIYAFLCQLQDQGVRVANPWTWGAAEALPFTPRVRQGRLILAPATWRFRGEELAAIAARSADERCARMRELQERAKVPRFVLLRDGDRDLPVDFDNPLSIDALLDAVDAARPVALTELLPSPDELVAVGPEGHFSHELIVPFVRRGAPARAPSEPPPSSRSSRLAPPVARSLRSFGPGSEWLYMKVYAGPAPIDGVLRALAPVVRAARAERLATSWFFLRFADPETHVRLRFFGDAAGLWGGLLPRLDAALAPLRERGVVYRTQLDTYEREIERYGGLQGVELFEELSCIDSEAMLGIVELLEGEDAAEARWKMVVRGADALLDDFGLALPDKLAVLTRMRDSYHREFSVETPYRVHLGDGYRAESKGLAELLDRGRDAESWMAPGLEVLAERSRALAPLAARIRALSSAGVLARSVDELLPSYIHLSTCRLLRSSVRQQELVLYEYLARAYEGLLARATRRRRA